MKKRRDARRNVETEKKKKKNEKENVEKERRRKNRKENVEKEKKRKSGKESIARKKKKGAKTERRDRASRGRTAQSETTRAGARPEGLIQRLLLYGDGRRPSKASNTPPSGYRHAAAKVSRTV